MHMCMQMYMLIKRNINKPSACHHCKRQCLGWYLP
uniref:Uncharacterized protein n=1 Tax=Anguilla anguilla TaxID=7936 RepID=A0A0E9Q9E4_ANGAN